MKSLLNTGITLAVLAALTGCNAITAAVDNSINSKQSHFSQLDTTTYPTGEGPYDAEVKKSAVLAEMQATQAANAQYPTGAKAKSQAAE